MRAERIKIGLREWAWLTGVIWIGLQILLVLAYGDFQLMSDSGNYADLAQRMSTRGEWYPTGNQIAGIDFEATYIIYPGVINLYAVIFSLFGTVKAIFWLNILLNIVFALSVKKIASTLLNKRAGYIAVILFFLCPMNITHAAMTLTEIPSLTTVYAAAALCCLKRQPAFFFSGILCALAVYERPTTLLIAVTLLAYLVASRCGRKKLALWGIGAMLMATAVLWFNYRISDGYVFYGANTFGVNMIIGATDQSSGAPQGIDCPDFDREMEGLDSFEVDSLMKARAAEWIMENPGKWIRLGFRKLQFQFTPETMIHLNRVEPNPLLREHAGIAAKCLKLIWLWYPWFYYIALALLAFGGIFIAAKRNRKLLILLFPVVATIVVCVLTTGLFRYNATFLPILMLYAAIKISDGHGKSLSGAATC